TRVTPFPIPYYRRGLTTSQSAARYSPGFNKHDGLTLHAVDRPLSEPHRALDYDINANLRKLPTGFITYQSDLTPGFANPATPRGVVGTLGDPLRGILESLSAPTFSEYSQSQYPEPYPHRAT